MVGGQDTIDDEEEAEEQARLGAMRRDLVIQGLYRGVGGVTTITVIWATDTDVPSYQCLIPDKVLACQKETKKKNHLAACLEELRHFVSYVCSVGGLVSRDAQALNRCIAQQLSQK